MTPSLPAAPLPSTTTPEPKPGNLRRRPATGRQVAPTTPHLYTPTAERPARAKLTVHAAETQVVPHQHPWAQLAYSSTGLMRVTAELGTFMAPPSRAVWIPPGVEHAVTAVESCHSITVYLHQTPGCCGPLNLAADSGAADWSRCRVLEVTELMRAVLLTLDRRSDAEASPTPNERQREDRLVAVMRDELLRARSVPLGLPMPQDKRLRQLCEAMLDDPARHASLALWAADAGASERTLARLFRAELNTSFAQWRQQALIARAMILAAQGQPMNRIASALGYASPSAFSAMVRRELGAPPRAFFSAA